MNLRDFFDNQEVRLGDDFQTHPPAYYWSLNEAFLHYFETFRFNRMMYHFLMHFPQADRKDKAWHSNGYEHSIFTLLSFHRFFELLIKDLLHQLHPNLIRPGDDEQIFASVEEGSVNLNDRTVGFWDGRRRLSKAFDRFSGAENYQRVLKDFEFMREKETEEALDTINMWRNKIVHEGKILPNYFALDFIVSQQLVPLVAKVINAHSSVLKVSSLPFLLTNSKVEVFDEISKIKYSHTEFENPTEALLIRLLKLGHLKEMGRTTFVLPVGPFVEGDHPAIVERAKRMAAHEIEGPFPAKVVTCPCCAEATAVIYEKTYPGWTGSEHMRSWVKCFNCDYLISDLLGDPFSFGLSREPLFTPQS